MNRSWPSVRQVSADRNALRSLPGPKTKRRNSCNRQRSTNVQMALLFQFFDANRNKVTLNPHQALRLAHFGHVTKPGRGKRDLEQRVIRDKGRFDSFSLEFLNFKLIFQFSTSCSTSQIKFIKFQ